MVDPTRTGHSARHGQTVRQRNSSGTAIDDVLRHDLWLECEQLGVCRVDYDSYPMAVRRTECFHPRKVFKRPSGFGTDERFIDAENVTVAVKDHCGFVVPLHLFGERLDVVV